jgi:putative redox protein
MHMPYEPIVVRHEGGMKFEARIRGHRLVVDQPESAGGEDAAPMPIELLGAALGTCVALYVQQFCQTRGLSSEGLQVEVQQHGVRNPSRVGRFEVRVSLPEGVPSQYAEMLERVARSCPAHHTLVEGAEVAVLVETGAVPAPG